MEMTSSSCSILQSSLLDKTQECNFLLQLNDGKQGLVKSTKHYNHAGCIDNKLLDEGRSDLLNRKLTTNKLLEQQPSFSLASVNVVNHIQQLKLSDKFTFKSDGKLVNSLLSCHVTQTTFPASNVLISSSKITAAGRSTTTVMPTRLMKMNCESTVSLTDIAASLKLTSIHVATVTLGSDKSHETLNEARQLHASISSFEKPKHTRISKKDRLQCTPANLPDDSYLVPSYKLTVDVEVVSNIPLFDSKEHAVKLPMIIDLNCIKKTFINIVSASLIQSPNFKQGDDPIRTHIISIANKLASCDPEFILKVALYARCELNIRTTANFLVSYASHNVCCRPYLPKYYCRIIRLPSDWIDVAEQYQVLNGCDLINKSLPAVLRRMMVQKFKDFDHYQLAKYNTESSEKKRKKKIKKDSNKKLCQPSTRGMCTDKQTTSKRKIGFSVDAPTDSTKRDEPYCVENSFDRMNIKFTLKQLIRKLHIVDPVDNVMRLIGRRYPATMEEFYLSRLAGTFQEDCAGKRMKLPVPETWETQVSLNGNKANTWQDLIDNKKLPFMAMLRNIRNMIKAGISEKHHNWILSKLSNKDSVLNSKQFPFRFFVAFDVLQELETDYHKNQKDIIDEAETRGPRFRGGFAANCGRKRSGLQYNARGKKGPNRGGGHRLGRNNGKENGNCSKRCELNYDIRLLDRYRKALDKAVQLSTLHNVKPIPGTSIILCDLRNTMNRPCASSRGLGKTRMLAEMAALLGLMCKYSCEDSQMIVFGDNDIRTIELEKGTILNNMDCVLRLTPIVNGVNETDGVEHIEKFLLNILIHQIQVNNVILLTDMLASQNTLNIMLRSFLDKYRRLVNNQLLFVNVDLGCIESGCVEQCGSNNENDICVAGFSDQILRFIAERGDQGQLIHVEKIDETYELKPLRQIGSAWQLNNSVTFKPETPLPVVSLIPRWRACRVFISSTFLDMHAERDLLTRFVFPELRARAEHLFVAVLDVDLRWGVTEKDMQTDKSLEVCLSEVSKCQLFVGILGERYGWIPNTYEVGKSSDFEWVHDYLPNSSITELEMYQAALAKPTEALDKAFFFFRDSSFMRDVPKHLLSCFEAENPESATKMAQLKSKIKSSGLHTFNGYPCSWGGVIENKPYVDGLSQFAERILQNLWNAVLKNYPKEDNFIDEHSHELSLHKYFLASLEDLFVGRKSLVKQCLKTINNCNTGLLIVTGKTGSGKSSLMALLIKQCVETRIIASEAYIFINFAGVSLASCNTVAMLRRFCFELTSRFQLSSVVSIADDYRVLVTKFAELLIKCGRQVMPKTLVFFIDGIDHICCNQQTSIQWLPETIPKNVLFVVSLQSDSNCLQVLQQRTKDILTVMIGPLDILDKKELVCRKLAVHGKRLEDSAFSNQMKILLSKKEASIPLYLSLACDELRMFGVYEKVTSYLHSLPHTLSQLVHFTLDRLERDISPVLVSVALSLLATSRTGLSESELHSLLNLNKTLHNTVPSIDVIRKISFDPDDVIPPLIMSKLIRALHCFLQPTMSSRNDPTVLCLAHTNVQFIIQQRYIKTGVCNQLKMHTLLAGYFYMLADPCQNNMWSGKKERAFTELPYHIACCECNEEICGVLCDLRFIHAKCMLGLARSLLDDFTSIAKYRKTKSTQIFTERISQYDNFVSRNLHILERYGVLTYQQAINEPQDTWPAKDAQQFVNRNELHVSQSSVIEWINKPKTVGACLHTLDHLPDVTTSLVTSENNQLLACGFFDCSAKIYNLSALKELMSFYGHSGQITSMCFVGTSRLCIASADNTLSLWDVTFGNRLAVLRGHYRRVNDCVSNGSGKLIISVGWDCSIKLWNGLTGVYETDLSAEQHPLNCLAMHCDNQIIAVGCWDATVKIYDLFQQKRIAVWRGHIASVRDVAFSFSGSHVASSSVDGDVRIWFTKTGSCIGSVCGHTKPVNRLLFTSNELITASDDRKIKVWSSDLGFPLSQLGSMDFGSAICVVFDTTGQYVAAGYHNGHVRLFDVNTGLMVWCQSVYKCDVSVNSIQFSNHQWKLLVGTANGLALLMDCNNGLIEQSFQAHSKAVLSVGFGSQIIVTASEDFDVHLYQASHVLNSKLGTISVIDFKLLSGHTGPVTCCSFNSDESRLATGSRDMSVIIWNVSATNGPVIKERVLANCHADWINCCEWSNTGNFLVTGSSDFNLNIWDIDTGLLKCNLTGHASSVTGVAYKFGCIASTSRDGIIKVWSHHGVEISSLRGHVGPANGCHLYVGIAKRVQDMAKADWATMMDDDEWRHKHNEAKLDKGNIQVKSLMVASCSDDGTVRLWLPTMSHELSCFYGHSDKIVSMACTGDGKLCSGSLDHSVKLWKLDPCETNKSSLYQHADEINSIVVSSDCCLLATASRDGMLKIWHTNLAGTSSHSMWKCCHTVKAHSNSVNCMTFFTIENKQMLVTGSDDASVVMWATITEIDSVKISKTDKKEIESPVTSVVCTTLENTTIILATQWKSHLVMWNVNKHGQLQLMETVIGHGDWTLCSCIINTTQQSFMVTGGIGQTLDFWKWNNLKVNNTLSKLKSQIVKSNWVTCLASISERVYAGSSCGQLICTTLDGKVNQQRMIHSLSITHIVACESHLFTSSLDGTIKIWNLNLEQVGLYFCSSPVKVMVLMPNTMTCEHQLICGTTLGEMLFLRWKPNK